MQNVIVDRVEKAREQMKTLRERSLAELQQRREDLTHKADETRQNSHEALLQAQTTVLETTRHVLAWAGKQISPLASDAPADSPLKAPATALTNSALGYIDRSGKALDEAISALRAGDKSTLPVEDYDSMSVKKVVAALEAQTLEAGALLVLRAYEADNKNRVTLLRELDARLEALSGDSEAA